MKKIIKYPDPLAPFSEKQTEAYGARCAKVIESEWFNGSVITENDTTTSYYQRRTYVREKRLLVRGENDLKYYKNFVSPNKGDLDWENLDWTSANWPEKYERIVSNGISDDYYTVNVRSVDSRTALEQSKKRKALKTFMNGKPLIEKFKKELNVNIGPGIEVPEDDEGLDLHMELNERPRIEIFEQLAIKAVLDMNDWDYIEREKNKDLTDAAIAVCRIWIDDNDGIKIKYVDPEFYIHSPVERNDFSDKFYEGYVETITLSDIQRESRCSNKQLRHIAKTIIKVKGNHGNISYEGVNDAKMEDLIDIRADVLRFSWKTSKTIKYKAKLKKGKTVRVQKRDETFNGAKKERKDFKEIGKTLDTWFEGSWVIGADYLYNYKESENLYDDVMNKAHSQFVTISYGLYENRLRSFIDNIEVPVRQLQKIHLLIQRLMAQLRPDIVELDLDMLAELDTGEEGTKKKAWETALTMLNVKGVTFKKRIDTGDTGVKEASAVKIHSPQQAEGLYALLKTFAFYVEQIRELTGINPFSDGTMPADSLVGVTELANLARNTITKHIVDAATQFKKKVCEVISSRLHLIYKYKGGEDLRKLYNGVLGKVHVDAGEVMKNRSVSEFGFVIELKSSKEEQQEFLQLLELGIKEGTVDVEIVAKAKFHAESDIKLAIRYLLYERKKRLKQKTEEQMQLAQNKSQNDAMAAQAKTQAETQAYQQKKIIDLEFLKQQKAIELEYLQKELQLKQPYDAINFERDLVKEQVANGAQIEKEKYKEDRKDIRTEKQASQQSKMIEQRNKDGAAVDFENPIQQF